MSVCVFGCYVYGIIVLYCFFSSRRRHTSCALVTGVQTCALPISCAVSAPVVFYSGWPFLLGMARELRQRRFGMDTLIATSVLLAWFASLIETIRGGPHVRSEEHTSELQSLMRISYAVFCLKKKINKASSR